MSVKFIPVGLLKPFFPQGVFELDAAGRTVEQALALLNLAPDTVAMVLVNGCEATMETVLRDTDVVKLIPFVGGG